MAVDLDDINWHDGVLRDIQVSDLGGKRQGLELLVDLYPDTDPKSRRRRYRCVGRGLRRFIVNGDVASLVKNAKSGNVDLMTMRFTADTEILVVLLFGGTIEAEAAKFTLTEVTS